MACVIRVPPEPGEAQETFALLEVPLPFHLPGTSYAPTSHCPGGSTIGTISAMPYTRSDSVAGSPAAM
jgi:hypothetical protein